MAGYRYLFRSAQLVMLLASLVVIVSGLVWAEVALAQDGQRLKELEDRLQQVRDEQIRRTNRLETIERRLEQVDALDLQRRLTRLETLAESNRTLLLTIAGAVILQVLATAIGVLRSVARRPSG